MDQHIAEFGHSDQCLRKIRRQDTDLRQLGEDVLVPTRYPNRLVGQYDAADVERGWIAT
jgi:hypothetical protein